LTDNPIEISFFDHFHLCNANE